MSNKTFNMPTENFENAVPLLHRQLVLSPESCVSVSPDSNNCTVNLSEREASTSPDINKKCCFDQCSSVFNINNATLAQDELFCVVTSNMNQTFIAAPVNGSNDYWNESLSCIGNENTKSNMYQTFSRQTDNKCNGEMSPGLGRKDSQLSPCEDSHRGSTENDYCSLSSGEMLMRSNSFCLEDQSLIVISSLEDSSISPAPSRLTLLAESNLLSTTTLAEVCEKSKERVTEENKGHSCLGITFTQADNMEHLTEEDDIATFNSPVDLPSENEGGLLMTFICETPSNLTKEAKSASVDAELLPHFLGAYTPEQTQGSCIAMFPMQDNDDIQTSTPVQNIGNRMPSLPLLSPSTGNGSSPGLQHLESHHISVTSKQYPVTGLSPSLTKVKKMEISKFPKTDLSNVKRKVQSGAPHQVAGPGSSSAQKTLQDNVSKQTTSNRKTVKNTPAKVMSSTTVISAASKILDGRQVNKRAMNFGGTVRQSCEHTVTDGRGSIKASTSDYRPAANNHTSAIHFRNASSEKTLADSSQVSDSSTQHGGSQTSASSLKTSPGGSGQMHPLPTSKKDMLHKTEIRSGSALSQERAPISKTRPRCSSESLVSRPQKEKIMTLRVTTSFTVPKAVTEESTSKPLNRNCFSQNKVEETKSPTCSSPRDFKKISLVSSKSTTAGAQLDKSKNMSQGQPSPRRERGTSLTQPTPATPRPNPLSARQRQGTQRGLECRTPRVQQIQQKNNAGSQKTRGTEEPSLGSNSQTNGSRPPQTTKRPSVVMGPPLTPAYRQPRKTMGLSKGLNERTVSNEKGQGAHQSTPASGGTTHKPTQIKYITLKTRLTSTPGKSNGQTLTTSSKFASSTNKGASDSTVTPLKANASKRFHPPTLTGPVDRSKPKASPRLQQSSQPNQSGGTQNGVQASKDEREDQNIQQLKQLQVDSDCRFQAVAVVLQHALAERDEATKQCRELSQELVNLREELVSSIHSSERLEKEKDEMRTALEDALEKMQEQHQKDLAELEQRLQALYQAEWNSVHLTYQEEADKCKTLMQHKIEELKADHEAMKQELENSHSEQLHCIKQQYEISLEELRNAHNQELVSLDKTLKDAEAALSEQIKKLTAENGVLMEKLAAEEKRRKELAENSQKDSHTLYLEQELESLKVVLDLKNEQLHQQEKKLMDISKLTEKNVKLDESLKKVQQENEDLKARMERHAALSRQLSSEQAMLQESLQKESKVNKRLSMENEELLWKLHNGDLSSPRRVSPSSTSPSFSLQSPSNSGLFSSPPLSPR